jgi:hypothetical protein
VLSVLGTLDTNTKAHRNVCVSDAGSRVFDKGYRDDEQLARFQCGWYDAVYWRIVGDPPHGCLAGGIHGQHVMFRVTDAETLPGKWMMLKLPDDGMVFCRGIAGDDHRNPWTACVVIKPDGIRSVRPTRTKVSSAGGLTLYHESRS